MVGILFSIAAILIFFYKSFLFGQLPFPGDLLVAEYKPWSTYSYLGYLPSTYPHKAQYFDVLRQLYPWKTEALRQVKQGIIPLWNPHNFSGAPLLANFQSAILYPMNFLYGFFSQPIAWSVLVILQPFLAFLFAYLYCQKMNFSRLASFLTSVSYAFSSFMTVWLEYNTIGHVIAWLPLALLSVESLSGKLSRIWSLVFILALVSGILAGHPQVFLYFFIFVSFYIWFRIPTLKRKTYLAFFSLLSLGVAAVQIIPGLELSLLSARSPYSHQDLFNKALIQPWQLIMLVLPDLFGNPATRSYWPDDTYVGKVTSIGIVPLFFILATLRYRNQLINFFLGSAAILLLLITNNPLTQLLYRLPLPFLTSSSPTLMTFLLSFSLSFVAGFGLDRWREEKHSVGKLMKRSLQVSLFFVIMFVLYKLWPQKLSSRAIFYGAGLSCLTIALFAVAIIQKRLRTGALLILLLVHGFDLFWAFHKFNPFIPQQLIFPEAPVVNFLKDQQSLSRFWGFGTAQIQANFATQVGLYSSDGYDPLYPQWYGSLLQASRDGKVQMSFARTTRSDAVIESGFGKTNFLINTNRLRLLNLLGIRYILDRVENASTSETFPPDTYRTVYDKDGWKVMENLAVLPRTFLAASYQTYNSAEKFSDKFFHSSFDPSQTILLSQDISFPLNKSESKASASIINYLPNEVVIDTQSDENRLLFLSDTYYPGWKASIDNKETPIYRANYAFRAVDVPAGSHLVRFDYNPLSFKIGLAISSLSLLVLSFHILIYGKRF